MKFSLLTIAALLFIPAFAGAQFYSLIDNFDALPDTNAGYGWYDDGGAATYINRSVSTDEKYEGTGAMRVEWQNQRYDQWGGWIGLNYFDPDSGVIEEFGLYDTLTIWFNNLVPQSKSDVEFRIILYDYGPGTSYDEYEVWISHHLILDDSPGWQQIKVPMIDVGADAQGQHDGPGFWNPGWGQTAEGNGILDLDAISGWAFEWSQGTTYEQGDSISGVILFDDMRLSGIKKVDLVFFNGKNVPGTVNMHTGWSGSVAKTEEVDADPSGVTGSVEWTTEAGWDGVYWDMASTRNMVMAWSSDTLQFKIKAEAGLGDLTVLFRHKDSDTLETMESDHEFQATYALTEQDMGYDGTWKQVKIALKDFNRFAGVWSNVLNAQVPGEFDSTRVYKFWITGTGQGAEWAGKKVYFDDVWTGNPEFDFIPPEQVTGVATAPGQYYNQVFWDDLASETGETYSVYASTKPITDINDPTLEVVETSINPDDKTQSIHFLQYPLKDANVTTYYAVTCTDASGNTGEAGLSDPITNAGKGVPTISLNPPANFAADGDLTEWDQSGIMSWVLTATGSNIAAGDFDNDDDDLTAEVWLAMDDNNLYVACDVIDNDFVYDPGQISAWWTQDAFEFFIGLWDQNGKPIHEATPPNSRGAEPDYKLIFLEEGYYNEYKAFVAGSPEFTNEDANYFFEALGSRDYVIEASIPLDSIAYGTDARFHPKNGMRIMFDLVFHDNDANLGDQGGGNLTWSDKNRDLAYLDQHEWTNTWIGDTTHVATAIDRDEASYVNTYELRQNYPNPFNPVTTIEYSIAQPGRVQVEVFNLLGERVLTLIDQNQTAGNHRVQFDGAALSSGVYFYSIKSANFFKTRKMILLK